MKVFVEKTSPNVKNEEKMTKTSKFLGFLIKSCILPIRISNNKVKFRFFSAKMMLHVLGIVLVAFGCVSYGFIFFPTEFTNMFKKAMENQTSWIEDLSYVLGGFGPLVLTSLPSALGYGLKNINSNFFMNRTMKWPKIAWLNIAGRYQKKHCVNQTCVKLLRIIQIPFKSQISLQVPLKVSLRYPLEDPMKYPSNSSSKCSLEPWISP